MASYKDYKSISAAKKAGSMYFMGKDGKKKLAVTKEQLDAWKKKNKGKYKGSALTAWANAKGKNITAIKPKKRPEDKVPVAKPGSLKKPEVTVSVLIGSIPKKTIEKVIEKGSTGQQYTKWFNKNKNKYKKSNGGFDHPKALRDFNKMRSNK